MLYFTVSSIKDGSMRNIQNQNRYIKSQGIKKEEVVKASLCHSDGIKIVERKHAGKTIRDIDGLITREKNLYLAITVADCLPVVIIDEKKDILCLLHAGWKGLHKKIVAKAIRMLIRDFKCQPSDFTLLIGPSIGQCHFEAGKDLYSYFREYKKAIKKVSCKTYLNLQQIASSQALSLGVNNKNIIANSDCTWCNKNQYFSKRRQKENWGTMLFIASMR